jgi:hypothetical protein
MISTIIAYLKIKEIRKPLKEDPTPHNHQKHNNKIKKIVSRKHSASAQVKKKSSDLQIFGKIEKEMVRKLQ